MTLEEIVLATRASNAPSSSSAKSRKEDMTEKLRFGDWANLYCECGTAMGRLCNVVLVRSSLVVTV